MLSFAALASAVALAGRLRASATEPLTRASIAIRDLEHCAATDSRWDPVFEGAEAQLFAAQDRVKGFLGNGAAPSFERLVAAESRVPPRCSDEIVASAKSNAEASLLEVDRLADQLEAETSRGAWLGLFPLCKGTVRSAHIVRLPEPGQLAATIRLLPRAAEEFNGYSGLFASYDQIGARMLVRINGVTVAKPRTYDAIKTELTISASPSAVKALVAHARRLCRSS
jgi:hypothetical protein